HYYERAKQKLNRTPRLADVLNLVLEDYGVTQVEVPSHFPVGLARRIRARVKVVEDAFFSQRETKTPAELRAIRAALRLAETGLEAGLKVLRESKIRADRYLTWRGQRVTSELVRGVINATIAQHGGLAAHTIVAGGNHACDPHEAGHGPLRAHQPIILDVFPRDLRTGYWGDITRTVVRGRASEAARRQYETVARAQQQAIEQLRDGVDGQKVHNAVHELFRREGYVTGVKNGFQQGFFHGTGHGLGLEIHEPPRISSVPAKLKAGHVVTVEPGLYYRGVGGVRIEDVVVIEQRRARVLTRFPHLFELR
ncbi:MAG: M24 family metallopeptidase, partial [Verrucomicrobiae bacterium]|nr:M24 family metallopeptidase [Verrucomicrobiae bacterium]